MVRRLAPILVGTVALGCTQLLGVDTPRPRVSSPDAAPPAALDCQTDRSDCSGVCRDLAIDPAHCGACNHDCHGGECHDGRCMPVTVVSELSQAPVMAVDARGLVWTFTPQGASEPWLGRAGADVPCRAGDEGCTVIARDERLLFVRFILLGERSVAIQTHDHLLGAPRDGLLPLHEVAPRAFGGGVQDGVGAYVWTDSAPSTLTRLEFAGPNLGAELVADPGADKQIVTAALGDRHIFLVTAEQGLTLLRRLDRQTDARSVRLSSVTLLRRWTPTTPPSEDAPYNGLTVTPAFVYFFNARNQLLRIPVEGCPREDACEEPLATDKDVDIPIGFWNDGTSVYWATSTVVRRTSLDGVCSGPSCEVFRTEDLGAVQIRNARDGGPDIYVTVRLNDETPTTPTRYRIVRVAK